jgi:glycosyltransferase involved in cell wall biosynthesis
MPVGVNTDIFGNSVNRDKDKIGKILFLARISRSKRLEDLIKAVSLAPLIQMEWSVQVTGPTISEDDKKYLSECRDMIDDLGLTSRFVFTDGIPFIETPRLYSNFDIFINCSKTGMYDKTIYFKTNQKSIRKLFPKQIQTI